jgi:hypothetical protein
MNIVFGGIHFISLSDEIPPEGPESSNSNFGRWITVEWHKIFINQLQLATIDLSPLDLNFVGKIRIAVQKDNNHVANRPTLMDVSMIFRLWF